MHAEIAVRALLRVNVVCCGGLHLFDDVAAGIQIFCRVSRTLRLTDVAC